MAKKALGRGLSALIHEEILTDGNAVLEIDIELIAPNPEQPRTRFTDSNLDELAQSIRSNGIVQPIVVRKKGNLYEIVAGERRWRASQRIGLKKIPAIIKEVSDDKLLEIALIENIQRQELNPMEEARAYKKLIVTVGLTQELVAERVGKNRTVIATHLRLLKLPADIQKLIEEEKLSAGHGRALLTIDNPDDQRRVARMTIEMSLSVRETEKAAKRVGRKSPRTEKKKETDQDPNVKAAETRLRRHFGTGVHIVPDSKGTGGRIQIEYYGAADLDRIYNLILKK